MKRNVAFALLIALVLAAAPSFAATAPANTTPVTPVVSNDLTADEFLAAGVVTTELVAAVRCDVPTLTCDHVDADCGVEAGHCHCKAGGTNGSQLVCVKNPGGGGPIE